MENLNKSLRSCLSNIFHSPLLEQAIEYLADPIFIVDKNKNVVWVNREFEKQSGFICDEIAGMPISALIFDRSKVGKFVLDTSTRDVNVRCSDGSSFRADEVIAVMHDLKGIVSHYVSVLHDRMHTDHALHLERLRASQDPLTGLPGRVRVLEALEIGLQSAKQTSSLLALIFIDLDGFKLVNDHFGHLTGDALLQAVGLRLQGVVRTTDTVGRFGGDEFVVVLPSLGHRSVAIEVARKLVEQLERPFSIQTHVHRISASLGLAFAPDDGSEVDVLIARADAAMYEAKRQGGRQVAFCRNEPEPGGGGRPQLDLPFSEISAQTRNPARGSLLID